MLVVCLKDYNTIMALGTSLRVPLRISCEQYAFLGSFKRKLSCTGSIRNVARLPDRLDAAIWWKRPSRRSICTSQLCRVRGSRLTRPSSQVDYDESDQIIDDYPDAAESPHFGIYRQQHANHDIPEGWPRGNRKLKNFVDEAADFVAIPREDDQTPGQIPQPQPRLRIQDQAKKVPRPKIDPRETSIVLFPGQGSQFVGMGEKLLKYPNVREIYGVASEILGYDLLKLCLEGPKEDLDRTVYCQTAVFVTSIAALEKLKVENFQAIQYCAATAGFSVGEYASLVFAGCLSFEECLKLVKARAEAMQMASEMSPGGMLSVQIDHDSQLQKAMELARRWSAERKNVRDPYCQIASYLFPEGRVIAGNNEALDFIEVNAKMFKIKPLKRLPVSGAFHTPLMTPAKDVFYQTLKDTTFKQPSITVYSNVTALSYGGQKASTSLLLKQISAPVKWEQILHSIYEREKDVLFPNTYEVGPGKQLGTILKRTNLKAFASYKAIEV
ncbi:hypothetical protein RvY_09515 [Ramazzottius varieornatus]|uniref:[acyl-carrier-protein] S-malonyltransferase n=1 Tax=Ramazzottius varieornatus TaxID=947166 RepID=A0A1D1VIQ3_RAMVA|nr:hypothetical protein RvY_09515 [Ramazzottius varieornatus]